MYIWIQGIIPDSHPFDYVYVNDFKGNVADMPKNSPSATFTMLLPGKESTISLPRLVPLRIYLSFGEQLFTNPTRLVLTVHSLASSTPHAWPRAE